MTDAFQPPGPPPAPGGHGGDGPAPDLPAEPQPELIHVVGAAIVEDGRCLVAQRGESMTLTGKWEFPGGKVEAGETPREALAREIAEELELTVEVGERLGATEIATPRGRCLRLEVYLARQTGGTLRCLEHRRIAWLGPEELAHLDWAEPDIPLLEPLARVLRRG